MATDDADKYHSNRIQSNAGREKSNSEGRINWLTSHPDQYASYARGSLSFSTSSPYHIQEQCVTQHFQSLAEQV